MGSSNRDCPACNSRRARDVGAKNGFQLLRCEDCRTLYVADLLASDNAYDYDDYYSEHNLVSPDFVTRRLQEIVAEFARYRVNNRLLDIGFGAGGFMQAAAKQGWHASGVEVSLPAVRQARAAGFDVFHGGLVEARYPAQGFDVVIASEVLEHVPDPQSLVNEAARILRPGGLFWATTPHVRGLSYRLVGTQWTVVCPPEHLQLFSRRGLKLMLAAAGFRKVALRTEGINPFEILHTLKSKGAAQSVAAGGDFDRVNTAFDLNEKMMQSPTRRMAKKTINTVLDLSAMGDSLKVAASL